MEYRFSLTPRLVAIAAISLVALFVLLFVLGLQIGQRLAVPAPRTNVPAAAPAGFAPVAAPAVPGVAVAPPHATAPHPPALPAPAPLQPVAAVPTALPAPLPPVAPPGARTVQP